MSARTDDSKRLHCAQAANSRDPRIRREYHAIHGRLNLLEVAADVLPVPLLKGMLSKERRKLIALLTEHRLLNEPPRRLLNIPVTEESASPHRPYAPWVNPNPGFEAPKRQGVNLVSYSRTGLSPSKPPLIPITEGWPPVPADEKYHPRH